MKHNHGLGAIKALGGRIAAVLLGVICAVCVCPLPAFAADSSIANATTGKSYTDLATAVAEAQSGDPSSSARATIPSTA